MMSPEMNRWQMALVNSFQGTGQLAARGVRYFSSLPSSYQGVNMCCLGVCLHANGAEIKDLIGLGMPKSYHLRCGNEHMMPIDRTIQNALSDLNDEGLSHRIIRELLIDFVLTGDPTEIMNLSKNYFSFVKVYGK